MKNKKSFRDLRASLEGKTVSRIEPGQGECICNTRTEDGVQFSLYANNFGFWIDRKK